MNTITPIIIPIHTSSGPPPEDPKCPHCHAKLPGWSKPSNLTSKDVLSMMLFFATVIFCCVQFFFGLFGAVDGDFHMCESFGQKRYHYVVPTYYVGCVAGRWITNKEYVFRSDYDAEMKRQDDERQKHFEEMMRKWGR